jgi:NADPH2:quinone reductase
MTMRAVRVREYGPPSVLKTDEAERPVPGPGQVVVEVEVAGIGYGDVLLRSGRYPWSLPYVPGLEVGGRIVELGPETEPELAGRRVVATTHGNTGGYAEAALADAASVHVVPEGLALEQAVAVFQAGAVAVGVLDAMRVAEGETLLVTAAAGRIGSLLVQLATAAGARVIAAVGGPAKAVEATRLGAHAVVDYLDRDDGADWVEQVRAATDGRGVDVALDAIGGVLGTGALASVRDGSGRLGVYGFTSGQWTPLDAFDIARRGVCVTGPLGIAFAKPAAEQRADARKALTAAASGALTPRIHAVLPLEQAAEAHAAIEDRGTVGAVLLKP